ncbi:hypothetical protein LAD77_01400 [Klebsiella pneumoniae]|nr:hypothetical protein [Klebsiella pneumoniae]
MHDESVRGKYQQNINSGLKVAEAGFQIWWLSPPMTTASYRDPAWRERQQKELAGFSAAFSPVATGG